MPIFLEHVLNPWIDLFQRVRQETGVLLRCKRKGLGRGLGQQVQHMAHMDGEAQVLSIGNPGVDAEYLARLVEERSAAAPAGNGGARLDPDLVRRGLQVIADLAGQVRSLPDRADNAVGHGEVQPLGMAEGNHPVPLTRRGSWPQRQGLVLGRQVLQLQHGDVRLLVQGPVALDITPGAIAELHHDLGPMTGDMVVGDHCSPGIQHEATSEAEWFSPGIADNDLNHTLPGSIADFAE